jgi:hypothetical protein
MTPPTGLSAAALDRVYQAYARFRRHDYAPFIVRALLAEVFRRTDPGLAARVRGLSKEQLQGLVQSLHARYTEAGLRGAALAPTLADPGSRPRPPAGSVSPPETATWSAGPRRVPPPPATPGRERRAHVRRGGEPTPVLLAGAGGGEPLRGSVLDRSQGGLQVASPVAFAVGAVLSVCSAQYPDVAAWVTVEVRHCRPAGNRFLLGCQFQTPPPWGTLLLFG